MANAYHDKLDQWPRIGSRDSKGLRSLTDFPRQCDAASVSITFLDILNDERENRSILTKLSDWIVLRCGRVVTTRKLEGRTFPTFREFVNFLQVEAKIASDPIVSLQ